MLHGFALHGQSTSKRWPPWLLNLSRACCHCSLHHAACIPYSSSASVAIFFRLCPLKRSQHPIVQSSIPIEAIPFRNSLRFENLLRQIHQSFCTTDLMGMRDTPSVTASMAYIQRLIEAEVTAGTPENRIVLGGFSQVRLPPFQAMVLPQSVHKCRQRCSIRLLCAHVPAEIFHQATLEILVTVVGPDTCGFHTLKRSVYVL